MNNSLEECASVFLRYRSLPHEITLFSSKKTFSLNVKPNIFIHNEYEFDAFLKKYFLNIDFKKTGIMLSGGIDSVLLASYMPKGSCAFTISYPEVKGRDEVERARYYADKFGLKLIEVPLTFDDVLKYQDELIKNKQQPLASIEVGIYKMSLCAKELGIEYLLTGMAADGSFGGFFNLLSRDWTNNEFVEQKYEELGLDITKKEMNLTFAAHPATRSQGVISFKVADIILLLAN